MTHFYRYLQAGLPKAQALRLAQRQVRKQYDDPYFWAAFTLTGNPDELFTPPDTLALDWLVLALFLSGNYWLHKRRVHASRK